MRSPTCVSTLRPRRADDGAGGVRVRPGGVRLPRHGPGDDRGRLVRPGHRQRAVGLRAVDDRDDARTSSRSSRRTTASTCNFERAKDLLEENDGAGNTFKATAKPVLIGTAVVGATTMIFSIIVALTNGLTENVDKLSMLHPPFLLGLITGGAVIYWFTGASTQAVTTGAYRAVEFIKANIKLDGRRRRRRSSDSKKVVEICTQYAQKGMFNIFLTVFFSHAGVRVPRAVLLHRLPDLDRALRSVSRRSSWPTPAALGQREEDRRGRAEGEGHAAARRDGRRRHGRRSVQGHVVGGDEPGHQVHDAVRPAGGGTGVQLAAAVRRDDEPRAGGAFSSLGSTVFVWRSFYGMRIQAPARAA